MQQRPAIIVSGTVRDSAGTPIVDASVFFEEKATVASIEAKTDHEGTFSFLSLRAGSFLVRARKEGLREAVSGPMELSLGQKKQLDLVLSPKPSVHAKKAIESKFTVNIMHFGRMNPVTEEMRDRMGLAFIIL